MEEEEEEVTSTLLEITKRVGGLYFLNACVLCRLAHKRHKRNLIMIKFCK